MYRLVIICALSLGVGVGAARSEGLSGTWLTGPDKKGQVGHVAITPCGAAHCGTVIRAFDPEGKPVITPNVGKRVIWDLKPAGQNAYAGRMHVSQLGKTVDGTFRVNSGRLKIRGCLGPVCRSQTWKRIH